MAGLSALRLVIRGTHTDLRALNDEMDRSITVVDQLPASPAGRTPIDSTPLLSLFRSGGRAVPREEAAASDAAGDLQDVTDEVRDVLAEIRDGQTDLADLIPNQKDLIAQIEQTDFGPYLSKFVQLYLEKLTGGSSITPQRLHQINDALYSLNTGAQDIIKKLTGKAGERFSFAQLEQDIKALVAAQNSVKKATKSINSASRGTTTGTLGTSPQTGGCSKQAALSVLLSAGALR